MSYCDKLSCKVRANRSKQSHSSRGPTNTDPVKAVRSKNYSGSIKQNSDLDLQFYNIYANSLNLINNCHLIVNETVHENDSGMPAELLLPTWPNLINFILRMGKIRRDTNIARDEDNRLQFQHNKKKCKEMSGDTNISLTDSDLNESSSKSRETEMDYHDSESDSEPQHINYHSVKTKIRNNKVASQQKSFQAPVPNYDAPIPSAHYKAIKHQESNNKQVCSTCSRTDNKLSERNRDLKSQPIRRDVVHSPERKLQSCSNATRQIETTSKSIKHQNFMNQLNVTECIKLFEAEDINSFKNMLKDFSLMGRNNKNLTTKDQNQDIYCEEKPSCQQREKDNFRPSHKNNVAKRNTSPKYEEECISSPCDSLADVDEIESDCDCYVKKPSCKRKTFMAQQKEKDNFRPSHKNDVAKRNTSPKYEEEYISSPCDSLADVDEIESDRDYCVKKPSCKRKTFMAQQKEKDNFRPSHKNDVAKRNTSPKYEEEYISSPCDSLADVDEIESDLDYCVKKPSCKRKTFMAQQKEKDNFRPSHKNDVAKRNTSPKYEEEYISSPCDSLADVDEIESDLDYCVKKPSCKRKTFMTHQKGKDNFRSSHKNDVAKWNTSPKYEEEYISSPCDSLVDMDETESNRDCFVKKPSCKRKTYIAKQKEDDYSRPSDNRNVAKKSIAPKHVKEYVTNSCDSLSDEGEIKLKRDCCDCGKKCDCNSRAHVVHKTEEDSFRPCRKQNFTKKNSLPQTVEEYNINPYESDSEWKKRSCDRRKQEEENVAYMRHQEEEDNFRQSHKRKVAREDTSPKHVEEYGNCLQPNCSRHVKESNCNRRNQEEENFRPLHKRNVVKENTLSKYGEEYIDSQCAALAQVSQTEFEDSFLKRPSEPCTSHCVALARVSQTEFEDSFLKRPSEPCTSHCAALARVSQTEFEDSFLKKRPSQPCTPYRRGPVRTNTMPTLLEEESTVSIHDSLADVEVELSNKPQWNINAYLIQQEEEEDESIQPIHVKECSATGNSLSDVTEIESEQTFLPGFGQNEKNNIPGDAPESNVEKTIPGRALELNEEKNIPDISLKIADQPTLLALGLVNDKGQVTQGAAKTLTQKNANVGINFPFRQARQPVKKTSANPATVSLLHSNSSKGNTRS